MCSKIFQKSSEKVFSPIGEILGLPVPIPSKQLVEPHPIKSLPLWYSEVPRLSAAAIPNSPEREAGTSVVQGGSARRPGDNRAECRRKPHWRTRFGLQPSPPVLTPHRSPAGSPHRWRPVPTIASRRSAPRIAGCGATEGNLLAADNGRGRALLTPFPSRSRQPHAATLGTSGTVQRGAEAFALLHTMLSVFRCSPPDVRGGHMSGKSAKGRCRSSD